MNQSIRSVYSARLSRSQRMTVASVSEAPVTVDMLLAAISRLKTRQSETPAVTEVLSSRVVSFKICRSVAILL